MKAAYIPYEQTHAFSKTVISYLADDEKLKPFIAEKPDLNGFASVLSKKNVVADRHILSQVLGEQYANLSIHPSVSENIELLKQDDTFTVTTGHQLNIFTGPLFFLFKIVHAINLAKELKLAFPDENFVPVYWMATEDHDFAEINHAVVHGKNISWDITPAGATGKISTDTISETVRAYRGILGISENAVKLGEMVDQAYSGPHDLSTATRVLVNELFGQHGLVIIDADDKHLKEQFKPIIKRDIFEQNSFREINNSVRNLHEAGFDSQVNSREINFFYMKEGFRERLVFENNQYYVLNSEISFSKDELESEIENHPERFSPNVMLRPLYQEVILPNIAYIGGGAEVAYWLQLKANFDFYKIDFPIVMLRNSAMIADEETETKLQRLDLTFTDLFTETDLLKSEWVKKHSQHELTLADEWKELRCVFEKIKLRAYKIDTTLAPSTEAVRERLKHQLKNLEKKLVKAEKRNHSTALSQIDAIKVKLFPGNGLQERKENFGSLYVKYGDCLISDLLKYLKPLDFNFTILY